MDKRQKMHMSRSSRILELAFRQSLNKENDHCAPKIKKTLFPSPSEPNEAVNGMEKVATPGYCKIPETPPAVQAFNKGSPLTESQRLNTQGNVFTCSTPSSSTPGNVPFSLEESLLLTPTYGAPPSPVPVPSTRLAPQQTFHEENVLSLGNGNSGFSELSGLSEFFKEIDSSPLANVSAGQLRSFLSSDTAPEESRGESPAKRPKLSTFFQDEQLQPWAQIGTGPMNLETEGTNMPEPEYIEENHPSPDITAHTIDGVSEEHAPIIVPSAEQEQNGLSPEETNMREPEHTEENPPSPDDRVQTVERDSGQHVFVPGGGEDRPRRREPKDQLTKKQQKQEAKRLRDLGKEYISFTTKKTVPERQVKAVDCSKCRLKCSERISEDERRDIHRCYWTSGDYDRQRDFISMACVNNPGAVRD